MLSKYHPVGIMVYGTAELMGFPWETVIKIYREDLGKSNFKRLIEFAQHFIAFLENNRSLFTESLQTSSLEAMCHWILSQLREKIDKKVKEEIGARGEVSDTDITRIIGEVIAEAYDSWTGYRRLKCFPDKFETELIEKYKCTPYPVKEVSLECTEGDDDTGGIGGLSPSYGADHRRLSAD